MASSMASLTILDMDRFLTVPTQEQTMLVPAQAVWVQATGYSPVLKPNGSTQILKKAAVLNGCDLFVYSIYMGCSMWFFSLVFGTEE